MHANWVLGAVICDKSKPKHVPDMQDNLYAHMRSLLIVYCEQSDILQL